MDHPDIAELADWLGEDAVARARLRAWREGECTRREAIDRRNRALLELARAALVSCSISSVADRLAAEICRYRAGGWLRDRLAGENPHPPGSRRAALWAILAAVDRDLSPRQVRRLLAIGERNGQKPAVQVCRDQGG